MLHSSRAKKAAEQYDPQATITSEPPEDISVPVSNSRRKVPEMLNPADENIGGRSQAEPTQNHLSFCKGLISKVGKLVGLVGFEPTTKGL